MQKNYYIKDKATILAATRMDEASWEKAKQSTWVPYRYVSMLKNKTAPFSPFGTSRRDNIYFTTKV